MLSDPVADPDRIAALLGPASMWGPIEYVAETGSTNADVSALAATGTAEGYVRVAGHQRTGRGRFDRVWLDEPGRSVAMSMLVRPTRPFHEWGWLSLLAGMAVADGIRRSSGVGTDRVSLKWPNDALVDGRKVCGILSETDGRSATIGLGINVAMATGQLPVEHATSLLLAGLNTDTSSVVAAVLASLDEHYQAWQRTGDLRDAYTTSSDTIGRQVRVILGPNEVIEGRAVGIDVTGALLVDVAGVVHSFAAGDVVHLR